MFFSQKGNITNNFLNNGIRTSKKNILIYRASHFSRITPRARFPGQEEKQPLLIICFTDLTKVEVKLLLSQ